MWSKQTNGGATSTTVSQANQQRSYINDCVSGKPAEVHHYCMWSKQTNRGAASAHASQYIQQWSIINNCVPGKPTVE